MWPPKNTCDAPLTPTYNISGQNTSNNVDDATQNCHSINQTTSKLLHEENYQKKDLQSLPLSSLATSELPSLNTRQTYLSTSSDPHFFVDSILTRKTSINCAAKNNLISVTTKTNNQSKDQYVDESDNRIRNSVCFCLPAALITTFRNPIFLAMFFLLKFSIIFLICYFIVESKTCLNRYRTNIAVEVQPINGGWTQWSHWSKCDVTCQPRNGNKMPRRTRFRKCKNPPPANLGKNCAGISQDVSMSCPNISICPQKINGAWTQWSEWSKCSATCANRRIGKIPYRRRTRNCTNPSPQNDGKTCLGMLFDQKKCKDVKDCAQDGQWGEWYIKEKCNVQDSNLESCSLGNEIWRRECDNPKPVAPGKFCPGKNTYLKKCWPQSNCPVNVQAPNELSAPSLGNGSFLIIWHRTPYGSPAIRFVFEYSLYDAQYLPIANSKRVIEVKPRLPFKLIGEWYRHRVDLKAENKKSFEFYQVKAYSKDLSFGKSTLVETPFSSVNAIDGQWGKWSENTECSARCSSKVGVQTRERTCNNPKPNGPHANNCPYKNKESKSCLGLMLC